MVNYFDSPLFDILWDLLVRLTPSSLVEALDGKHNLSGETKAVQNTDGHGPEGFAAKSEAMRRILGFEGTGGILTNFQKARISPGINSFAKSPRNHGLPGLGNWDNSCYQNSVIQGLASSASLTNFLDQATSTIIDEGPYTTIQALRDIIKKLNDPLNADKMLWTPAKLKSMSSWQQQDAQEYYSKVLDEIEKESSHGIREQPKKGGLLEINSLDVRAECKALEGAKVPHDDSNGGSCLESLSKELDLTLLKNPLEGLLAQRVGCLKCGFVDGLSLIPFNCLTVPLGSQRIYDIRTCLDEYTTLESISGVECSKCTLLRHKQQLERLLVQLGDEIQGRSLQTDSRLSEVLRDSTESRLKAVMEALYDEDFSENTLLKKCQIPTKSRVSATKSRQAVIARPPKSLVMHINRSVFDETTGAQRKNYTHVSFPEDLDLSPWCLGTSLPDSQGLVEESWNMNPSCSMLLDQDAKEDGIVPVSAGSTYVLQAVVTHYGRHENGHYICYRRDPRIFASKEDPEKKGAWWRLSDEDVSKVSEENVLAQGGVFMLFYELIDRNQTDTRGAKAINSLTDTIASMETSVESLPLLCQSTDHDPISYNTAKDQDPSIAKTKPPDPNKNPTPVKCTSVLSQDPQASNVGGDLTSNKGYEDSANQSTINIDSARNPISDERSKKGNRRTAPRMRTAGPRNGRGSGNRTGNAIASIASMVTAN